ncbi:MAG: zinc-binding dehydrogenase [Caldilineaceae bacterium SB0675_bin_29]|uniref:Zinc-binding dehydrogenase n=1 Tax=Caldilineaceae bacterium SB0675_bin_29 TaxID=2605266 RepID=A0A6B1G625_9CHLR|nr:zinc-binding dehydrogenase [Caldilineaceae bacterium SB0675_bin_29]
MHGHRLVFRPGMLVEVEEFNVPAPGANEVLVRATCSQVSAGTELNQLRGMERSGRRAGYPGYAAVGRVLDVGGGITDFAPGSRVLIMGRHATHWTVDVTGSPLQDGYVRKLDDTLTDEQATFAINGATALHAVRRARLQIDESVVVFGVGVVGQLVTALARLAGAFPIIAVDLVEQRLQLARQSGATHVVNAVREVTSGGAQCLFHASANPKILQTVFEAAGQRAKVVMVGSAPGTAEIGLQVELLRRELHVLGAYELDLEVPHVYWPWTPQRDRAVVLRRIADQTLAVDHLISPRIPYTQAPEIYAQAATGGEGWLGIILTWDA